MYVGFDLPEGTEGELPKTGLNSLGFAVKLVAALMVYVTSSEKPVPAIYPFKNRCFNIAFAWLL